MITTTVTTHAIPVDDAIARYCDPPKYLEYCKECHNYGHRWSCPPFDFDAVSLLQRYATLHVVGVKVVYDEQTRTAMDTREKGDAYTTASVEAVRERLHPALRALEQLFPDSMAFISGNCKVCPVCARDASKPCCHPDLMRYSLEAFGFDLMALTQDVLGITIVWEPGRLPAYYTLIGGLATNSAVDGRLQATIEEGLAAVRQP